MTNAQVYHAFKSYVSRLHDVLNMRRNKKTKLVISAPFDFKKEDSMCFVPGHGEELYMLREKAAASIVGTAFTNPYNDNYSDTATLAPSSIHDLHLGGRPGSLKSINRSTSSFEKHSLRNQHLAKSMTAPLAIPSSGAGTMLAAPPTPTSIRSARSSPTSPMARRNLHVQGHYEHTFCGNCQHVTVKKPEQKPYSGGYVDRSFQVEMTKDYRDYEPSGLSVPSSSSSAASI